jgi:hypothetical protein
MAKAAQRQILAKISPVANATPAGPAFAPYFAQVSGGEVTASVEKIYLGGKLFPEVLPAPAEIGDITVTAHFDNDVTDVAGFLMDARQVVGRARYDVTIYATDTDFGVIQGASRNYPNCLLVGLTDPEGDSSSGAPATFALTFSVSSVTPRVAPTAGAATA